MDLADWLTIATLCASGAVTPGPSLAVVLKNTIDGGASRGLAAGLGHGLGVGLYAFGAVAGFSVVVAAAPSLERLVSIAGGLFLVYMGWQALVAPAGPEAHAEPDAGGGFRQGFAIAFLNPKIAVFFLALLGSFVPEDSGLPARAGVATVAMTIDAGWYMLAAVVLAGSGLDRWLAARARPVAIVSGLVFGATGLFVLAGTLG